MITKRFILLVYHAPENYLIFCFLSSLPSASSSIVNVSSPYRVIIVPMKHDNVKLLAIVGMAGSGKSVVVSYLANLGYPKIHFGNMIYQEMAKRGIERTTDGKSEKAFREMIRATEGQDWVARQAIAETKDLVEAGQKHIVLDGLYSWTEYRAFQHEFPGALTLIAIVAPKALRYERIAKRPDRPFDAQAVRERDYHEIETVEKGGPIAIADYYIINDGSVEDLENSLKKILKEIQF